jgi:hypothetical protein
MLAVYTSTSPWKDTPIVGDHLSFLKIRAVPAEPDDFL